MENYIEIKGARIHNLKNVDVRIPKNKLTVITGVSGSGKSSLAFDTLYEEGKRRYLLFSGTQFMVDAAPSFDKIHGLSPTIAVEQRIIRQSNPRSTVGTRTKTSNMLAAFFATYGLRDQEYDDGHPLSMEMFQKNSPKGMCIKCLGVGTFKSFDENRLFEDNSLQLDEICFAIAKRGSTRRKMNDFCRVHGITIDQQLKTLSEEQLMMVKYGDGGQSSFVGFIPLLRQILKGAFSSSGRLAYLLRRDGYLKQGVCPRCNGTGLGEQATHTRICGKTINELEAMYIKDLLDFIYPIEANKPSPLLHEIIVKLECKHS
jgi:excinuclease UvrABC ATPase subunit